MIREETSDDANTLDRMEYATTLLQKAKHLTPGRLQQMNMEGSNDTAVDTDMTTTIHMEANANKAVILTCGVLSFGVGNWAPY